VGGGARTEKAEREGRPGELAGNAEGKCGNAAPASDARAAGGGGLRERRSTSRGEGTVHNGRRWNGIQPSQMRLSLAGPAVPPLDADLSRGAERDPREAGRGEGQRIGYVHHECWFDAGDRKTKVTNG